LNKQEFTHLLKNYSELGSEHIAMLKEIVKEYPYFSSANVLLAKAMSNDKHYEYEKQLKATALITGDRSVLYKIINSIPLKSVDELHSIAEIPTALRVEKISKPDFVGLEEELPAIEEPQIEERSIMFEEVKINEPSVDLVNHKEDIVEESLPIIEETKHEIDATIEETPFEKVESAIESETNHLTQWNSFEHPFEKHEKEELNEVELALDEELRNEARSIIEEAKQHPLVEDVLENVDLIPEDSLALATGNLVRFENIRDENSLINLDDDDMLVDFDFDTLEGEIENSSFSQSNILPEWFEPEKIETPELEIFNSIEPEKLEIKHTVAADKEINDTNNIQNKEKLQLISESNFHSISEEVLISNHRGELEEIIVFPDSQAKHEEDHVESFKHESLAPSLENLLDFEEEIEVKEALADEPLSNWTEENTADFQQTFEEPEVSEKQEEITKDTEELEHIAESEIEHHIELEKQFDKNEVIDGEPIQVIHSEQNESLEGHDFMDWLVVKKDSNLSSVSHIDSADKINEFSDDEDDEFTLTIRQLIKERTEKSSNISNELTQDLEEVVELENIVSNENIEETIVESIPDFSKNETQEENTIVEEKTEEVHPFYDYKVESVLPDFEQMVLPDLSDEETNEYASELHKEQTFEEKIITDEIKLVFHPIHGLVPASFDDDATEISDVKKQEPIIEPWTDFNESLILPTEEKEIVSTAFIHEEEWLGRIGEIQIDFIEDSSDEEEEEHEIPVFDEVSFSDADFDKGFSSQFVPLAKPEEPIEVIDSDSEITQVIAVKSPDNIIAEPKVLAKDEMVESIIDKFIRENPNISRPKAEFYNPSNMAKWSAEEDDDLVSETLANVYLGQGLIKKAISTYEKLGLIYPHKMSYFAALINQLKTTHKIE